jgi:hypothetical protein
VWWPATPEAEVMTVGLFQADEAERALHNLDLTHRWQPPDPGADRDAHLAWQDLVIEHVKRHWEDPHASTPPWDGA